MLRRERDTGGTAAAGASPLHHALLDEGASSLAYSNILHARELQQALLHSHRFLAITIG